MATKKAKAVETAPEVQQINVCLNTNTIRIPIVSVAPLIMSRFDEKSKTETQRRRLENSNKERKPLFRRKSSMKRVFTTCPMERPADSQPLRSRRLLSVQQKKSTITP